MHVSGKILAAGAGAALTVALTASYGIADPTPAAPVMTIKMHAQHGSGQDGTATLRAAADGIHVFVSLTGEPKGASEPAHVHFGRCPTIKAVPAYNVGPIIGGQGADVVHLTWAEITSGKYVINVHESTENLGMYVSCGDIGGTPASPSTPPPDNSGY